ncbi:MAG: sulfotransferase domain-containing protein [Desulfobacterales bacterium]|nr:sulfotransferase domain-containing protein [Desulfobacterales bacterium]
MRLPDFETWVKTDLELLNDAGVLTSGKDFAGSTAEYEAWDKYLNVAKEGPVGRSMYAIQLEHWYDALKAIGRDPTKDIFIVRSEDLKRDLQTTMDRIFSWLELPKQTVSSKGKRNSWCPSTKNRYMANETRAMLEEFFNPYNQRLYDMLGGDWPGVWEHTKELYRCGGG